MTTKKSPIFPEPGRRAVIFGRTGSGKTVMMAEQARQTPTAPVVIVDTKIDRGFETVKSSDETLEIVETRKGLDKVLAKPARRQPEYIVVRPHPSELADAFAVDGYLETMYERGRCTVLIDEGYQVHHRGNPGPGLIALLTRGRSRGITTIVGSQRPVWISRFCLTEADIFIVYTLSDDDDKKRLSQVCPYPRELKLPPFHFWAYKQGDDKGKVYAPLALRGKDSGYTPTHQEGDIKWF